MARTTKKKTPAAKSKKPSKTSAGKSNLQGIVDAIGKSQAVIEFEMDGTIITANDNFLNTLGYTLDEVQGRHHSMFVDEAFKVSPEYKEFWAKLNRGEFEAQTYKRLGKGGKEVWIQASYNPILDRTGKPIKVIKYATDVTEQTEKAEQFSRLQGAIEGSATPSIHINTDLEITYANQATIGLVTKNIKVFQEAFPNIDFNNLIGVCIDVFHEKPEYQRRILGDPNNLPHQAEIQVGDLKFALNISAMRDNQGNHIGACLEWQDVTVQKAAANRAESLYSMIQAAATNFMTCDTDLVITYCNPAVLDMLRLHQVKIRQLFPAFDPEKLIGTCIDIFHKNPAHQRQVLGDVKNLPVKTELLLGELEFGVNATALYDAEGNHIGNGVEWEDLNARAAYRREVTKVIESSGNGDLTERGGLENLDNIFTPMMEGINTILDAFERSVQEVVEPVSQVASASSQITEGAQKIAEGASSQASAIEQISASLEQMSSMTSQNADNATQANNLSKDAVTSATQGNEVMQQMENAINRIKASSDETAKIVKTIDEIAFQTNLLALNAAVEAARAGDAGKGFAVVAEEVRSLAQRSAEAAKNTATLIEEAVKNAEGGVTISEQVRKILTDIMDGSKKVNDLIGEIAAASSEQADGIKQITEGVSDMDKVTQENAANSEESAAAAKLLNEQAGQLDELIGQFQISDTGQTAPRRPARAAAGGRTRGGGSQSSPAKQKVGAGQRGKSAAGILPLDDDDFGDF